MNTIATKEQAMGADGVAFCARLGGFIAGMLLVNLFVSRKPMQAQVQF